MDLLKGFVYSKHFAVDSKSEKEIFLLQTKKRGDIIIDFPLNKITKCIRNIVEIWGKIKQNNIVDHGGVTPAFTIVVSKISILSEGLIPD
jgi:hypothetical protein